MTAMLVIFFLALVFLVAASAADTLETHRGIIEGISTEKNTWLVGPKPTLRALILRDTLIGGMLTTPAVICLASGNWQAAPLGIIPMIVMAAKHLHGALAWKKLGA